MNFRSFLPKFDINDKSLTFIKHLLQGSSLVDRLDDIVKQVADKLRTEPIDYPDGMPLHQIRRRLKKTHQFETTAGDRLSMIDKLLDNAVHGSYMLQYSTYMCLWYIHLSYTVDNVLYMISKSSLKIPKR